MIEIYDDVTLTAALAAPISNNLSCQIEAIASDARASDLWQLTCIVIVEANDNEALLRDILGFDPLLGPLGYDEAGQFMPWWSFLQKAGDHYELLHCVGDFAYYVLVAEDGPEELVELCRSHSNTTKS